MKLTRALIAAAALCAALFASQLAAPTPAEAAAGTILCEGWQSCESLGMTTHGYITGNSTEYWKMVSGHNCTNYTAYMLVSAGMANVRPWTGNGNANAWGGANAQMTDATPTVGSIAWWDSNKNGAGSVGHVAYVEQVFADHIVISEDNYGGDFHYRIVYINDKTWPTGFIHLKDATTSASFPAWRGRPLAQSTYSDPARTAVAPVSTLTPGSSAYVSLSFQNTGDSTWSGTRVVTAGATSALSGTTWAAPNSPVAQKQAAVVTGGTATFSFAITVPTVPDGTQFSETFNVVDPTGVAVPFASATMTFTADSRQPFTAQPQTGLIGQGTQGQALLASGGVWAPVQPAMTFQWMRDDKPIAGATAASYVLTGADVGHHVALATTATATGYRPVTQSVTWPTVIASSYGNTLVKRKTFAMNAQIVSANGVYRLVQGKKGNLAVVNRFTSKTVWSSKKYSKGAYSKLLTNGVLTTYTKSGKPIWSSPTKGKHVKYAVVTNTGKLALYTASAKLVWASKKN